MPLPGGLRCNPGGRFALIRTHHPRPVPHRPPSSALDIAEPRGVRRPHRQVLPLRPHPRRGHWDAAQHSVPSSGPTLAEEGVIARQRRPGGVYRYVIVARFLPAARGVSHSRDRGVPPTRTEEQVGKKRDARARDRFARSGVSFGEMPDDRAKWQARLRSWRQSRFWLPLWGPKPTEPGCFAPPALIEAICGP